MSHAISWDCPSCKRPGKLVPASLGDPAFWICVNTKCHHHAPAPMPDTAAPRREDAAGERVKGFDLIGPQSVDPAAWERLLADYHRKYDECSELRAALSTAERERDELRDALANVVVKCIPSGTQDGDFVLLYKIPTGPIHHAIPLLDSMGVTVRPGFDGRARVPSGGET